MWASVRLNRKRQIEQRSTSPQSQAAAAAAVLLSPPRPANRGKRPEVFPTSAHSGGVEGTGHGPQTGAAGDQDLSGAGAQQRVAGGAVLPAVRLQPLVPCHPGRPGAAHGALGPARPVATGGPCGSPATKPHSERIHPPLSPQALTQAVG
jgi:hypothetical protein